MKKIFLCFVTALVSVLPLITSAYGYTVSPPSGYDGTVIRFSSDDPVVLGVVLTAPGQYDGSPICVFSGGSCSASLARAGQSGSTGDVFHGAFFKNTGDGAGSCAGHFGVPACYSGARLFAFNWTITAPPDVLPGQVYTSKASVSALGAGLYDTGTILLQVIPLVVAALVALGALWWGIKRVRAHVTGRRF